MKKKKPGRSDVSVTPLAFGAWAIGGWMWGVGGGLKLETKI